ncbi:hypothetical protein CR155_09840 [Pollutimonas nitritireducens]|uniref:PLD phosphodiesterase domain-containing protein n=1 Tax=Pollutimonas nitritireducens TaxID=2045209 RepID=A0A2N4UFH0_9BURK|nr:phospholipase D family protein [Pollutimonas nitritireducens]PLC53750.1 hypothetical protein CR155_09840 [Pollutimonas nitritireducens]
MSVPARASLYFILSCLVAVVAGCTTLPSLENRTYTTALPLEEANRTTLGKGISHMASQHPGKSGIHMLSDPRAAFAVRALLAKAAERTLDVQYYIWHKDLTGTLMFEALRAAAERGVRVRLLLDDNNPSDLDPTLSALDSHPNIEVRLFNPFVVRSPKWLGYITDFSRANRRMHNKSYTADNQITIVGGRNMGDEYFGATDGVLFADLDVAAIGPIVKDVSDDFDRYWNSQSSYPVALILPKVGPERLKELTSEASILERDPRAETYIKALRDSGLIRQLADETIAMDWAHTRMVSDDPRKGLGQVPKEKLLTHELGQIIGEPQSDVKLISPYFVPAEAGVLSFTALAKRGVKLQVLTNSLDATDVAAVHAGYAKRREPLLKAGVELYEMKRMSDGPREKGTGRFGSSGSSLHAKTFTVDSERVFVGSFNFDPRSAKLNTELGFVIESPEMAMQINTSFNDRISIIAYEVKLTDDGDMYWIERKDGEKTRYDTEPHASLWRRICVKVFSMLPIDWLL